MTEVMAQSSTPDNALTKCGQCRPGPGDRPNPVYTTLAVAMLALSTLLVIGVGALTLAAAARREICVAE